MIRRYFFVLILLIPKWLFAFHIIGGEMYYTCLGNNNYQITLKIYRDCSASNAAPYDNPAYITVYTATGLPVETFNVSFPGATSVQPDLSNPCLEVPPGICVEQGVYQFTVTLNPTPGGYDIAYQRCCRNSTVFNIYTPDNTGATYTAHIPDVSLASCNSSPRFSNYPPIVICSGTPLVFDHSATDPDGDDLRYSLCTPNAGASAGSPQPNPPPPPPYDPILWKQPYSVDNQIGGNPPMQIDSLTGLLTANPVTIGQFVVGICVKEYRNGNLLSQNVRDFQFNVTTCNASIIADFSSISNLIVKGDTFLACGNATISFNNQSYGSSNFSWDFGVPGINTDVSSIQDPSYTYPDTGIYKVTLIAGPGLQCGDTIYKYIEVRDGVTTDFSFQNQCVGMPFQFNDLSVALDGTLDSWQWVFDDGGSSSQQNPSHTYGTAGDYNVSLTVANSYGCSAFTSHQVTVYPNPEPLAAPDTFVCDVDSVTLHAEGGVTYLWQPNYNINDPSSSSPVVDPKVTTVYSVTVTSANGCVSIDSVTIQITDTVIASAGPDTTICEGESVQLNAIGGVYYIWQPAGELNNALISDPLATPSSTTTFTVDSYIGSCVDEDTLLITVLPSPDPDAGPDVTINQGESTQLSASGGVNYSWQPPDALSDPNIFDPVASPINTVTYTVTVEGGNGCKAIDSVTITVTHDHQILAPTAFTPNGDGRNDLFLFFTRGIAEITSVKIFDRWGELVYFSTSGDPGWDGTYKGLDCEMETYVYLITGITYDGDELQVKGPLTLIR